MFLNILGYVKNMWLCVVFFIFLLVFDVCVFWFFVFDKLFERFLCVDSLCVVVKIKVLVGYFLCIFVIICFY